MIQVYDSPLSSAQVGTLAANLLTIELLCLQLLLMLLCLHLELF